MAGMIGRILSILSTKKGELDVPEWKVELNKGLNIQVERYAPAGDDSQPLPEDRAGLVSRTESGAKFAVGAFDIKNPAEALPGEKRLYGRDEEGSITSQIFMKNDGTIEVSNVSGMTIIIDEDGNVILSTSGDTEINSSKSTINNDVEINGNLQVNGFISATNDITTDANIIAQGDITAIGAVICNSLQVATSIVCNSIIITTTAVCNLLTATTNATIGTISFLAHIHGGVRSGTTTTDPPE